MHPPKQNIDGYNYTNDLGRYIGNGDSAFTEMAE
jgi:hypothetical protein